uniref:Secreted protein n=1 Tax=Lutzomyia longipalpis TaxID=7200 RepID=A0A1B0CEQ9_LUTLO
MRSEVLLSLLLLFVAIQPFPGALCQDYQVAQAGPNESDKKIRQVRDVACHESSESDESYESHEHSNEVHEDEEGHDDEEEPEERRKRSVPPYPDPRSQPHQDFPKPQKFFGRFRRFAKGTGALPQRKG